MNRGVVVAIVGAFLLAGCGGGGSGGSSGSGGSGGASGGGGSGSGSTAAYTTTLNDAIGKLGALGSDVPSTAAQFTALAVKVHAVVVELQTIRPPTSAAKAPLAAFIAAIAHYESDLRAVAARGGTAGITSALGNAISADGTAIGNAQEKLVLY